MDNCGATGRVQSLRLRPRARPSQPRGVGASARPKRHNPLQARSTLLGSCPHPITHADRAGAAGTAYKGRPPRLGRVAHRRQGAEGRVHLQLPPTPSASPNLVSRQRLLPVRAQKPWLHRRRRRLRAIRSGLCLRVKSARTNKRLRNQEDRANGPPAFLKSWMEANRYSGVWGRSVACGWPPAWVSMQVAFS